MAYSQVGGCLNSEHLRLTLCVFAYERIKTSLYIWHLSRLPSWLQEVLRGLPDLLELCVADRCNGLAIRPSIWLVTKCREDSERVGKRMEKA